MSGPLCRFVERHGIALAALTFALVLAPLFVADFGVHNDYRIGKLAGDATLALGHFESFHLVRAGRILNALLYNLHWSQIDAYTDLRWSRLLSSTLLVLALVATATWWSRTTALARPYPAFLALALFLTPAITVDAYYAQQLVPGSLTICLTIALYAGQRVLLERALAREGAWWAAWLNATLLGLVAGHFLYTPSTAIFLVLACVQLLYGAPLPHARRAARAELAIYAASYVAYFLLQTLVVFPWATRAFAFSWHWFDPQYDLSIGDAGVKLHFLRQALDHAANAWNAFRDVDVAWAVAALVSIALVRRRQGARFVAAFFAACFALALAPFLVSDLLRPGYRMLVGPLLLVATAVLWSVWTLAGIDVRSAPAGRSAWTLAALWISLAALCAATIATGVRHARAEIECFEDFVRSTPADVDILLLAGDRDRNGLRLELDYTAFGDGPLASFGDEIVRDLARRGAIDPARAKRLRGSLRSIDDEQAKTFDRERFAVASRAACPTR